MNRSDVISKHYQQMCNICKVLSKNWEDLCHDLCEYFLTCKTDIIEIEKRGKFLQYFYTAAYRRSVQYTGKSREYEGIEEEEEKIDVVELIKRLDSTDLKFLSIFATGATISEVSIKMKLSRITLRKHLTKAQKNAKQIIGNL